MFFAGLPNRNHEKLEREKLVKYTWKLLLFIYNFRYSGTPYIKIVNSIVTEGESYFEKCIQYVNMPPARMWTCSIPIH